MCLESHSKESCGPSCSALCRILEDRGEKSVLCRCSVAEFQGNRENQCRMQCSRWRPSLGPTSSVAIHMSTCPKVFRKCGPMPGSLDDPAADMVARKL